MSRIAQRVDLQRQALYAKPIMLGAVISVAVLFDSLRRMRRQQSKPARHPAAAPTRKGQEEAIMQLLQGC